MDQTLTTYLKRLDSGVWVEITEEEYFRIVIPTIWRYPARIQH